MDNTKYYVFYDGDCGFCNRWIQWVLKNDRKDEFRFASLQSNFGQQFLYERGLDRKNLDTIYLWKPGGFYLVKSQAVKQIAKILGGKYKIAAILFFLPTTLSDFIYDKVAKNRMKLSENICPLPNEKDRKKFMD
ncbi:MAG: DUF393 domain-containing protein [Cruoricaptor ignavus]|nr:DUF393 domain-containing protein [Cruoricaptor ignavus]